MIIGAIPDPLNWDRWDEARALLEPARARGDFPEVIEPDEALYVVLDGDELLAAATARFVDSRIEVILIGGRDHRRWLEQLDNVIGRDGAEAGATHMSAIGRGGWARSLKPLGWERLCAVEDHWLYARELGK